MLFTTDEIDSLRDSAEAHMLDVGRRKILSTSISSIGEEVRSYANGSETICGVEMEAGEEKRGVKMTTVVWDAQLRLPVSFVINEKDRFEVTSFRGEVVTILFEVVSPIQKGISANRVKLQRVEI